MKFLKIYFISKIFFFLKKIIFKKSSPDFGKPQKFHDFVFSSPEFKQKSFPPEKDSTSPGERSSEFRRFHFNQTFSPTNFEKYLLPKKMIIFSKKRKRKLRKKIFSPDFQNSTEDQFLPQHFMRNLPLMQINSSLRKTF